MWIISQDFVDSQILSCSAGFSRILFGNRATVYVKYYCTIGMPNYMHKWQSVFLSYKQINDCQKTDKYRKFMRFR